MRWRGLLGWSLQGLEIEDESLSCVTPAVLWNVHLLEPMLRVLASLHDHQAVHQQQYLLGAICLA